MKALFFDFDGVVLRSTHIKTKAYEQLFKPFRKKRMEIVKYHLKNQGISRDIKIRFVYKNILKLEKSEAQFRALVKSYSELVLEDVLRCPFIGGAKEFLVKSAKLTPLYVVSGTPEKELRFIVKKRGLARFFAGVYGSPRSKTTILSSELRKRKLQASQCVFFGDAETDLKAAKSVGMNFYCLGPSRRPLWCSKSIPYSRDFKNARINSYLERERENS